MSEPQPSDGIRPVSLALKGLFPIALLAVFVALFVRMGPVGVFRAAFPPVEELTFERIAFPEEGLIRIHLVNGGPEPVTIAQVQVDDAYWEHRVEPSRVVERLADAVVEVRYPWVDGDPVTVTIVTSTGLTFSEEVAVATRSPEVNRRYVVTFALLGVYVGVIPVFLGLLWLPFLAAVPERWLAFFLSFTIGLLIFLGVDALEGAFESTERVASAFQGVALILIGMVGAPLIIHSLSRFGRAPGEGGALGLSFLVAVVIGLHNLGEGLAIGAAYSVGEVTLGTTLVFGFLIHNTTEGLGIVAPIAKAKAWPSLATLGLLGLIAGAPTILGAWIGGFSFSPIANVLFLSVGAGAVVQVVIVLGKHLSHGSTGGLTAPRNAVGVVTGLVMMYLTGLFVAA
ncbi:MAG: metal transporter [Gemmatimonadota bacterium]|nr:MAG: metal transporter [Gemmatimonadota bacterium]